MALTAMQRFLKQNEANWSGSAQVAKEKPGFSEKNDGRYVARLSFAELGESQGEKKALQIGYHAVILEGDHAGELHYWWQGLEGERSFEFLGKDMLAFGYDPTSFELAQLPAVLAEIVESAPVLMIQLRTGANGYQNTYIRKVIEDYEVDTDAEEFLAEVNKPKEDEKPAAPAKKPATGKSAATPPAKPAAAPTKPTPGKTAATPPTKPATGKTKPAPAPEPEEEEVELEVGYTVTATYKGKTVTGECVSINEKTETAVLQTGKTKVTVSFDDISDVQAPEAEEDEEDGEGLEIEVGSKVKFTANGKSLTGIVKAIDEEGETLTIRAGLKTYSEVPYEDIEEVLDAE